MLFCNSNLMKKLLISRCMLHLLIGMFSTIGFLSYCCLNSLLSIINIISNNINADKSTSYKVNHYLQNCPHFFISLTSGQLAKPSIKRMSLKDQNEIPHFIGNIIVVYKTHTFSKPYGFFLK